MDRQAVTAVAHSEVALNLGFQCAPFSADQRFALGPADSAIATRWATTSASASPAAPEAASPAKLAAPSAPSAPAAPAPGAYPLSIEALRVSLAQFQAQQPGRVQSGGTDALHLMDRAPAKFESQRTKSASEARYRPYVGAQQGGEQLQRLSLSLPQLPGDLELNHAAKYPGFAVESRMLGGVMESSPHIPGDTPPSFGRFLEPQRKRRAWGSAGDNPVRAPPSVASSTPSTAGAGPFLPFRAVAPESNGVNIQSGPLVTGPANLQTLPANSRTGSVTAALSFQPSLQQEPTPVHRNKYKENNGVGELQVIFLMELSRRAAQNAQVLAATFPLETVVRPGGLHRKRPWSVAASPVEPPLHTTLFNQGSVATATAAAAAHCSAESSGAAHSSSLPAASSSPSHATRVRSRDESIPSLVYCDSAGPFSLVTSLSVSSSSPSFPISPVAVASLAGRTHIGGLAGLDRGPLDLELRL